MANEVKVKQSKNIAKIVGLLVENSLKSGTYKNSQGDEVEYIAGTMTIRAPQTVSGAEEIEEIPVHVWVGKYTKAGKLNPAYDSMYKAMTTYTSLAACEDESLATKVVISSGSVKENIFSNDGTNVFYTPRINTSFITTAGQTTKYVPEATFIHDIVVGKITEENDKDGVPTGRLKVKGMLCQYNGTMDVIDYIVENKNAIDYIRTYWQEGETVQISGKIRFTSKTETIEVPVRFGDPVFKNKTTTRREFIITADSTDVLKPEEKFTEAEIKRGIELRSQAVEEAKKNGKASKAKESTATEATNAYGF